MIAPIYIPTCGRSATATTMRLLDGRPYTLVVEVQDAAAYNAAYPEAALLVLPKSRQGVGYVRREIQLASERRGEAWHWQIDDNIKRFMTRRDGKRYRETAEVVLTSIEAEAFRYTNVGMAAPAHLVYAFATKYPISVNRQANCCMLIRNGTDRYFRSGVGEDTDFNLQLLTSGWCTLVFNRLLIEKIKTGKLRGGCTDRDYLNNGRIEMAKGTMRLWPGCFKLNPKNPGWLAPSTVWRTFRQRLKLTDGEASIFSLEG